MEKLYYLLTLPLDSFLGSSRQAPHFFYLYMRIFRSTSSNSEAKIKNVRRCAIGCYPLFLMSQYGRIRWRKKVWKTWPDERVRWWLGMLVLVSIIAIFRGCDINYYFCTLLLRWVRDFYNYTLKHQYILDGFITAADISLYERGNCFHSNKIEFEFRFRVENITVLEIREDEILCLENYYSS